MKRRDFIRTTAALAVIELLPEALTAGSQNSERTYISDAYDDNLVVRVRDPKVATYDFSTDTVYWKTIEPIRLKKMLERSLSEISGEKRENKAWKKILLGTNNGELSQKRIVIKVNFNNTIRDVHSTLNNSPAMMVVLTNSLAEAGFLEENICFFDCSRPFPDEYKDEVRKHKLTKVKMLGKNDELQISDKTIFISDNEGFLKGGKPSDRFPIPQLLIDADFMINLHLVKIHQTGVTGAMKNLYGLTSEVGFYMHNGPRKRFEVSYQLPDVSLDKEIKKRARLNIAEFIFGGHTPDTIDRFTNEAFFPAGVPASLIVSRSPFYHDTVLYGMIRAEYQTCVPVLKRYFEIGPDKWLMNSSERYSGWKYDQAVFVDNAKLGASRKDLFFKTVDFRSIEI